PPHHLGEICDATIALIDDPELTSDDLCKFVLGPDFPTGGTIFRFERQRNLSSGDWETVDAIRQMYAHGRGRVVMRAQVAFEEVKGDRMAIIVTELPYQVNKARLLERIAELVKEKKVEGITELRDESDKDGTRVVIELRRGENADVVLNNLFQHTQLQIVFGLNMVALEGGQPKLLSLKSLLEIFIRHRREVVTRRTRYLLRKARERAHVLEGLSVALANIDDMIELIRRSANRAEAREGLMSRLWNPGPVITMLERAGANASRPEGLLPEFGIVEGGYHLSEAQSDAILALQLHRLTGLEQDKIHDEFKELLEAILDYLDILGSETRLLSVIRGELLEIKNAYGDERRTEITNAALNIAHEDLIAPQDMVVTLSHEGYVKTVVMDEYQAQKRGGRGKLATATKEEDFVDRLWVAHSHDTLLCFSSAGKCYKRRVFELPSGSRGSRGKPFNNLLPLEQGEKINAVLPIESFSDGKFIFMTTRRGTVKKTELAAFANVRSNGIIAVDLRVDDELVGVALTTGHDDIILISDAGRAIRFNEADVRSMGRGATGVRGMRLTKTFGGTEDEAEEAAVELVEEPADESVSETGEGARVIALIVPEAGDILTVSEYGFGKRTPIDQFPKRGRGGQGVIGQALNDKTGRLIGAVTVDDRHEIMLISEAGNLIRTRAAEVRIAGRNTQGVRIMRPVEGDRLVGVDRYVAEEEEVAAAAPPSTPDAAPQGESQPE
ncbi:MAG: DNA gyrase subunit A, partial [Dongiaceae bacterium]